MRSENASCGHADDARAAAATGPFQKSGIRAGGASGVPSPGVPDLERAADRISRLTAAPHDLVTLWQETTDVLASAVPFYWTPCWYTLDPASLLMTSPST